MRECHARRRRNQNRAAETLPRFAGADARDHLVPADERADGIRAGVAEFRHDNEIKDVKFAVHAGEEIDFLDEVQQPRDIHQAEQRRRNGGNAGDGAARNKLPHAQTEHEQDDEPGFKIVHARRRTRRADVAGQIQKCPQHQQQAAEQPAPFEADQAALFGQPVKLRKAGQSKKNHDENEHAVGQQCAGGKQGRDDDRPENRRGD